MADYDQKGNLKEKKEKTDHESLKKCAKVPLLSSKTYGSRLASKNGKAIIKFQLDMGVRNRRQKIGPEYQNW